MNARTRWIAMTLSAAALLWIAASSSAQRPERGDGERKLDRIDRTARIDRIDWMVERLDLTDEQREKIEAIEEKSDSDRRELGKEERRAEHALQGELLEDSPNAGRVKDWVEKVGDVRTRLRWLALEERLAMREILTPEQRDRMPFRGHGFDRRHEGRSFRDRGPRHHGSRRVD